MRMRICDASEVLHNRSGYLCSLCATVLLTLRFSRKFGLVFCGVAGFFEDLRVSCYWACFNWNLLVFCRFLLLFAFFSNFMALLLFDFTAKSILGVFLWRFAHFGLVFRIFHPDSLFDFLANFSFCWIFLPMLFKLVFRLNYLFLACFSNLLACSWKITWHHWRALLG